VTGVLAGEKNRAGDFRALRSAMIARVKTTEGSYRCLDSTGLKIQYSRGVRARSARLTRNVPVFWIAVKAERRVRSSLTLKFILANAAERYLMLLAVDLAAWQKTFFCHLSMGATKLLSLSAFIF